MSTRMQESASALEYKRVKYSRGAGGRTPAAHNSDQQQVKIGDSMAEEPMLSVPQLSHHSKPIHPQNEPKASSDLNQKLKLI